MIHRYKNVDGYIWDLVHGKRNGICGDGGAEIEIKIGQHSATG